MTLDEAIKHAEEVADVCEFEASKYDMTDAYESHVACQEGKCAEEHRQLAKWLKELKQLRNQTSWILVSKRLPKEEDYRPCYGLPDGCVMWQTDNGVIGFGWYYDSTKCWSDIYDHPIIAGKVIAWMPLPEPYKEVEE